MITFHHNKAYYKTVLFEASSSLAAVDDYFPPQQGLLQKQIAKRTRIFIGVDDYFPPQQGLLQTKLFALANCQCLVDDYFPPQQGLLHFFCKIIGTKSSK